jgi:hypothetical protein
MILDTTPALIKAVASALECDNSSNNCSTPETKILGYKYDLEPVMIAAIAFLANVGITPSGDKYSRFSTKFDRKCRFDMTTVLQALRANKRVSFFHEK